MAPARDAAVARLQSARAAEVGGLADGSPGVAAQLQAGRARSQGRRPARRAPGPRAGSQALLVVPDITLR